MDLSKLTTSDRAIVGGGLVYLIAMFLPWYELSGSSGSVLLSYSYSGWSYLLGGVIPMILIALMVAQVLLTRFSPSTTLPTLPVPWSQVHLIAGAAAALIVLLRLGIASHHLGSLDIHHNLDRKYGLFIAAVAALAVAYGGLLKFNEGNSAASG